MNTELLLVLVSPLDLKLGTCLIRPFTEIVLVLNKLRPVDIEVPPPYRTLPVTSIDVSSQSAVLFSDGIEACETPELKVVIPDPVILVLLMEQFVVVGNDIPSAPL